MHECVWLIHKEAAYTLCRMSQDVSRTEGARKLELYRIYGSSDFAQMECQCQSKSCFALQTVIIGSGLLAMLCNCQHKKFT